MTMKKMFSAVVAAATLSTAVAAMSALNVNADSEKPVVANACFIGMIGAEGCWGVDEVNALSTAATINGNGQYEVKWDVTQSGGTDTVQFLAVSMFPAEGVTNFNSHTFPDLEITLDEVWVDNVLVEDYTVSDAAITTTYYEGGSGTCRIYLHDDWAGTGVADLPSETTIIDNIRVKFTISGLYNEGDSNVTEDPTEPTTEAPTDAPTEPALEYMLGDADESGAVDSSDASKVLAEYAVKATGGDYSFTEAQFAAADVNADATVDSSDASSILAFYAFKATGGEGTMEDFLAK